MRKSDTYRGARRTFARGSAWVEAGRKGIPWGDGWAVAANRQARLDERRKWVREGQKAVGKALAAADVLYHGVRHDIVALRALREHWATQVPCSRRMRSRMLKQLDLDLRSARA